MASEGAFRFAFACCLFIIILRGTASTSSQNIDRLISYLCDHSDSVGDKKWEKLCRTWFETQGENKQTDEAMIDEAEMPRVFQLRRGGRGGGGGGSRGGGGSSRGSSGSRTSGGMSRSSSSRTSGIARYRSTRTGASISRPVGHLWSRTRHTFLPISTRFGHRSRSSNNRYTTPASTTVTYYYCTSTSNTSAEIQCSTETGDNQCCEDEINHQPFCCGGKISEDWMEDYSQATKRWAKIFYTLTAVSLVLYLFRRR